MCGVWASLALPPNRDAIRRVAHRGPDGEGWAEVDTPAGTLALGHRRLSIIDVAPHADQPMSRNQSVIVFNGEIYNFIELRSALEAQGAQFTTKSDTEVLLAAWEAWGPEMLDRLRGMFAFVIVDLDRNRLFAARDRFGIKPLYLYEQPGGLAFASEIKQFLVLDSFTARVDPDRAWSFLAGGLFDHGSGTLFHGVRQLPGGHAVSIDLAQWGRGEPLTLTQWYQLPPPGSVRLPKAEAAERFLYLLDDAVRLHLRADVPLGSCLSGGLDSSSLVALVARRLSELAAQDRFVAITSTFDDAAVDERHYAEAAAVAASVRLQMVHPTSADLGDRLDALVRTQDEPFASTSIFAQDRVFAEARALGLKVMLDGQGADELLAGYHAFYPALYRGFARRGRLDLMVATVAARCRIHGAALVGEATAALQGFSPWPATRALLARRLRRGLGGVLAFTPGGATTPSADAAEARGFRPPVNIGALCRSQTAATNLPMLLHYEDRNSMAHGVEARIPFLDHPLAEFCIGLGDAHKTEGAETKAVLRTAMRGVVPGVVLDRTDKLGFATPERRWLTGPLRALIAEEALATGQRFPALFDRKRLAATIDAAQYGDPARLSLLWRIACFGVWGRVMGVAA